MQMVDHPSWSILGSISVLVWDQNLAPEDTEDTFEDADNGGGAEPLPALLQSLGMDEVSPRSVGLPGESTWGGRGQ